MRARRFNRSLIENAFLRKSPNNGGNNDGSVGNGRKTARFSNNREHAKEKERELRADDDLAGDQSLIDRAAMRRNERVSRHGFSKSETTKNTWPCLGSCRVVERAKETRTRDVARQFSRRTDERSESNNTVADGANSRRGRSENPRRSVHVSLYYIGSSPGPERACTRYTGVGHEEGYRNAAATDTTYVIHDAGHAACRI
jgi:hypothetical protein